MVTLMLDSTRLEVALSSSEHALAFRSQNVLVPRDQITKVQLTDDAWSWLRGVRAAGTYVPRLIAMGSWRAAGGRDFAMIRQRRAGVVIDLDGHAEFERLIVTTRHGLALVKALHLDTGDELADVTSIAAGHKKRTARGGARPATA